MEDLTAIYKFTYPKKQKKPSDSKKQKPSDPKKQKLPDPMKYKLPDLHYICQREDEKYFFYQLEGSNYISLEILLKSYLSQFIRLSIGQCLILIQQIYDKVIEVYKKGRKSLPLITLENIWIYTEIGFSGIIKPQKSMKIIFLNYQDKNVVIEENLKQLQLINNEIKKYCLKTEFKIRAIDGKNSLLIQQIMNIIGDMFYDIEMCLFEKPLEIKNIINKYVNDETQETDYEYLKDDAKYIQDNFENVIQKLNEIFSVDCQNELQLHKKMLNWQKQLFDNFIETTWDRSGHDLIIKILDDLERKPINKEDMMTYMTTDILHQYFKKLEQEGFLNFNSKITRLCSDRKFRRDLKKSLENEKNTRDIKKNEKTDIDSIFLQRVQQEKEYCKSNADFNNQNAIREKNQELIKNYYEQNAQNRYKLYDKFYYTINFQNKWTDKIKKEILPYEKNQIKIDDEDLDKTLTPFFEDLLKQYKMDRNNEEEKPKYI